MEKQTLFEKIKEKINDIYYDVTPGVVIRFFDKIESLPRETKFFFQRGFRGWADNDVWSLDYTLSKRISEMINHLADNHMGYPGEGSAYGETDKKWTKTLKELSEAFKHYNKLNDEYDFFVDGKFSKKKFNTNQKDIKNTLKKMKTMFDIYGHLWD